MKHYECFVHLKHYVMHQKYNLVTQHSGISNIHYGITVRTEVTHNISPAGNEVVEKELF